MFRFTPFLAVLSPAMFLASARSPISSCAFGFHKRFILIPRTSPTNKNPSAARKGRKPPRLRLARSSGWSTTCLVVQTSYSPSPSTGFIRSSNPKSSRSQTRIAGGYERSDGCRRRYASRKDELMEQQGFALHRLLAKKSISKMRPCLVCLPSPFSKEGFKSSFPSCR